MAISQTLSILEVCKVSPSPPPPPNATSLPLTFFDLLWLTSPSVQHLLFFSFPENPYLLLPLLKHSLSRTLHYFYPLVGSLSWSQNPLKPIIESSKGDSVSLTIAESKSDFHNLVSDYPRHAHAFHNLVPHLLPLSITSIPLLAVQITVFPNNGLCIGFTVCHGVADGSTCLKFLKSWAALSRLERVDDDYDDSLELPMELLPFYDRSVIKDLNSLERIYLNDLERFRFFEKHFNRTSHDKVGMVRATFTFSRAHIVKLNVWLTRLVDEKGMSKFYTSTFVVTCAYVLVCLVKARGVSQKTVQIGFATGCRTRLGYPIPTLYFGNCIGICWTPRLKSDMIKGEDGFLVAAQGLGKVIGELEGPGGVLRGAEEWMKDNLMAISRDDYDDDVSSNERVMIAGSLKLDFYDVDFGWGRPRKSEVISLERKGAFSLGQSGDEEGGVEVGVALTKHEMDVFSSLFVDGLKAIEWV